ncbi:MAG: hypothetical protein HYR92_04430 [Burkholderiales bacterium]|nr:hypothetical protein [Burkholderiales bacterium]
MSYVGGKAAGWVVGKGWQVLSGAAGEMAEKYLAKSGIFVKENVGGKPDAMLPESELSSNKPSGKNENESVNSEGSEKAVAEQSKGAAAKELGEVREQTVADAVGGKRSGEIIKTSRGSTDIDVIDPAGNLIAVGGPAKAGNLSNFVRGLYVYAETAASRGVKAYFYYAPGTPQSVIDAAVKVLGSDFVKPIPKR